MLAEIEFEDDIRLDSLPIPAFAHCEVTRRPEFTGGTLAANDPQVVQAFGDTLWPSQRENT